MQTLSPDESYIVIIKCPQVSTKSDIKNYSSTQVNLKGLLPNITTNPVLNCWQIERGSAWQKINWAIVVSIPGASLFITVSQFPSERFLASVN